MTLQRWLFAAMVAGAALGAFAQASHADWLMRTVLALQPIGTIFLRLVTMVVVPLVIASVFVSVASLGDVRQLGRIGGRTLAHLCADDDCRGVGRRDRRAGAACGTRDQS